MSRIRDIANILSASTDMATDAEVTAAISTHTAATTGIHGVTGAVVGTTDSQTLTNKTLTSPTINTATSNAPVLISPEERWTVSATSATGTIQLDADTQGVLYYTSNSGGNWTLNVRGTSGTTLNSKLAVGDSVTISFIATNSTAYYQTALTIDGNAQTVKWSGGTAPSAGNASSTDVYTFTIVKTAATPTYTVFGAGPVKYA